MAQYELNLRDYLRIFKKRKFLVILSIIVFTLLGSWYSSRQTPIYEAFTTVKIDERKTLAGLLTEWIAYNPADVLESQAEIIRGYPVMRQVALSLGMIAETTAEDKVQGVIARLTSQVDTAQVGHTNIIKITVTSQDPHEAMVLANAVASAYVEANLLEKNKQVRTVRTFIENQLSSLQARMGEIEDKLKAFSEKNERVRIIAPIQEKLIDLEFQLATLLQKYTEKHPKVIQLKQQIESMRGQIQGVSGEDLEYARLQREAEVDRKLYAMLKEKLEQARITEAEKVSDVSILDPAGLPTQPINAQGTLGLFLGIIMGVVLGAVLAFTMEMLDTSLGTIEDVEATTGLPVLGVIPSVEPKDKGKQDFLNKVIHNIFFHKLRGEESYVRLLSHYKPTSPIAESFRNIRTNLKVSAQRKTFLFTSSNPEEGKTVIVVNLGLVIAQENKMTLLVGSDLRRPAIARSFGINNEPGLSEILQGAASLTDCMRNVSDILLGNFDVEDTQSASGLKNIWVLPSGAFPSNASELLASKELASLIAALRQDFDCILFDSPPVLPVTDAAILAPLVDTVVLCYEVGRTSRNALQRAKMQLEAVNANIAGIILNHTKSETEPLDPYPYYYRYKHKYYREPAKEKERKSA